MSDLLLFSLLGFAVVLLFYISSQALRRRTDARPRVFPPGPKPDFLTGNLRHLGVNDSRWLKFSEWKRIYGRPPRLFYLTTPGLLMSRTLIEGDIVHLCIFGQHIVILNSYESATDLLTKRGTHSGRPSTVMIGEM